MSQRMRRALVTFLACAVALAAGGQLAVQATQAPGVGRRPNVLLIVLCSFRYDRLGAAGYWRPLTPHLDALARRGVFFTNAVSAASWTKPATASLLTGTTPGVHQLDDYYDAGDVIAGRILHKKTMPAGLTTLAENLSRQGYRTMARVNNVHAGSYFAMTRGFADERTDNKLHLRDMAADLRRWLREGDRRRPFFAMLFTLDAHSPYDPDWEWFNRLSRHGKPADAWKFEQLRVGVENEVMSHLDTDKRWTREDQETWIDLYDAGVAELDDQIGSALAALAASPDRDNTVVVVVADHGERFFEHGRVDHGWFPDQPVLHVPLIIVGPGIARGRRVDRVVRSIDLFPTLDALVGAPDPPLLQGRSLLPLLRQSDDGPPRPAVSVGDTEYALRVDRLKLRAPVRQRQTLYDVTTDPLEEHDLGPTRPRALAQMSALLERIQRQESALRARVGAAKDRVIDDRTKRELTALGYLH